MTGLSSVLSPDLVISASNAYKDEEQIVQMVYSDVTDDRIFGHMTGLSLSDYFDPVRLAKIQASVDELKDGLVLIPGCWRFLDCPQ